MREPPPISRFDRSLTVEHFKALATLENGLEFLRLHRESMQTARNIIHAKGEREAAYYRSQLAEADELLARIDVALGKVQL